MIPPIINRGLRLEGFKSFTESEEIPIEIARVELKVELGDTPVFQGDMKLENGEWRSRVNLVTGGDCRMTAIAYDKQGNSSAPAVIEGKIVETESKVTCSFKSPQNGFELPTGEHEIVVEASVA